MKFLGAAILARGPELEMQFTPIGDGGVIGVEGQLGEDGRWNTGAPKWIARSGALGVSPWQPRGRFLSRRASADNRNN
jgi:hypothetical protein